ncbi:MAG TPA: 50S ribosomal protein L25 [Gemmataceae bacterium]|jgi:large subunit ribosomal protein L25|nr:50S ribosomal protein L25 [Gemmataceae bacterium]
MAESLVLVAETRAGRGKQAARRLRRTGKVPAVLYGHKEETLSVALPLEEVEKAIRRGVRVVDLKAGGKEEKALIRDVQWDHLGKDLLHVDFARVAADERIVLTVPIELRGTAPGVTAGGVLDQPIHTLSIECLAISIPDTIRVNIGELQIGSAIHVRDLALPAGVKAMSDPEAIVVQVKQPVAEEEAPVAAEAAEAAEPEVIGAKEKAEAEEESE